MLFPNLDLRNYISTNLKTNKFQTHDQIKSFLEQWNFNVKKELQIGTLFLIGLLILDYFQYILFILVIIDWGRLSMKINSSKLIKLIILSLIIALFLSMILIFSLKHSFSTKIIISIFFTLPLLIIYGIYVLNFRFDNKFEQEKINNIFFLGIIQEILIVLILFLSLYLILFYLWFEDIQIDSDNWLRGLELASL